MSWASATWNGTVSADGNRIDWNNNSTWVRSSGTNSQSGSAKTQKTGVLTVPHAHGNCTTNACAPSQGCASCQTLTVYLPLTAQVIAIRCYTNAGGGGGDSGSPQQVACGDLDAWATFDSPKQYSTPNNTVVETVFHNQAAIATDSSNFKSIGDRSQSVLDPHAARQGCPVARPVRNCFQPWNENSIFNFLVKPTLHRQHTTKPLVRIAEAFALSCVLNLPVPSLRALADTPTNWASVCQCRGCGWPRPARIADRPFVV
jgi:hypothetical protein